MGVLSDLFQYDEFVYPFFAGLALTAACSLLSVLIVLKRLAFIGQGITHAGFGGIGLAAFLALSGWMRDATIFVFCVGAGVAIALLSRGRKVMIDTAIGVLLVVAMGLGVLLDQLRVQLRGEAWYRALTGGRAVPATQWEGVLFGNLLYVQRADMWVAIACSAAVVAILALLLREISFYAFDETVSRVFGVRATLLHYLVLTMIAGLIVVSMKLAGLILVTALLILPGATALLLSRRLLPVALLSVVVGEAAMVTGYLASLRLMGGRLSPGPIIVLVLSLLFAAALGWNRAAMRRGAA